jgi:Rrf2 family nitric oxide-sensitive transcriptional repressor
MEISLYSDYSFRVLMYLALVEDDLSQIRTISEAYQISENHLIKVVQHLVKLGYVASVRGRSGGIRLAKEAIEINLGHVFRQTEPSLKLLPCFEGEDSTCPVTSVCRLQGVFHRALFAFLKELDGLTLADLMQDPVPIKSLIQLETVT